jgi:hypothetical protein
MVRDMKHRFANASRRIGALAAVSLSLLPISASAKGKADVPRYAGALAFAPDGTLFVGDNVSSAVFAYKTDTDQARPDDPKTPPLDIESIDDRIAQVVRGQGGKVEINGLAVHPTSHEISETKVKIYHDAHAQWETRAPIRAMTFAKVDGKDTLVAAYTCSPLVLIPVEDLKNGAQVEGHVIGDMGNGQPLSIFNFKYNGEDSLCVTNAAHDPRIIPIADLQKARVRLPILRASPT